jgi:DNA-binding NtrC family response regulator
MARGTTQDESVIESAPSAPVPGLIVVFSAQTPMYRLLPLVPGVSHIVGRENLGGVTVPDERVSRQHAELCWSPGTDGVLTIKDLNSRNGVFVDGKRVEGQARAGVGSVVRLAQTILVVFDDLRRFYGGQIETEGGVVGPTLRQALDRAAASARSATHLVGHGETGSGKERMAEAFHAAVGAKTPFITVNCMQVQATLAPSLFFGVQGGVATNVKAGVGYLAAANGGVLFLDEIAELSPEIQGQLLRAVETGEVLPVGATTPIKVSVRIVAASHKELRREVDEGRFRRDLFHRLFQSQVSIPALRERKEELPWLMQHALAGQNLTLHASAVEEALLRPWPGNVRELLSATRMAASDALGDTENRDHRLRSKHLSADAGRAAAPVARPRPTPPPSSPGGGGAPPAASARPSKEEVAAALEQSGGNISATARLLNIAPRNRTQLYRLMKEYGLSRPGETSADEEEGAS